MSSIVIGNEQRNGITIRHITNVFYDKQTDLIIVNYEKQGVGITSSHFGPKAENILDLIAVYREYKKEQFAEVMKEIAEISDRLENNR
jgi:hypothetical protein